MGNGFQCGFDVPAHPHPFPCEGTVHLRRWGERPRAPPVGLCARDPQFLGLQHGEPLPPLVLRLLHAEPVLRDPPVQGGGPGGALRGRGLLWTLQG